MARLLVPDGLDWVFQKPLNFLDFHTQSLVLPENGPKNRNIQLCVWKCQRSEKNGSWTDIKATVTQITTCYNWGMQKSIYICTVLQVDGVQQQKTTPGANLFFFWEDSGDMTGKCWMERREWDQQRTSWLESNSGCCERSCAICLHTNHEAIGADTGCQTCQQFLLWHSDGRVLIWETLYFDSPL